MASYPIKTLVERTYRLTLSGTPAIGIMSSSVIAKYKKTGQVTLQALVLLPANWIELGNGYYTLVLTSDITDTLGTLLIALTGPGFDNIIYEQINLSDVTAPSDEQSYFVNSSAERTFLFLLAGAPAGAVAPSSVICKIKKSGQTVFYSKVLDATNWINIGNGFYTVKFSPDDLSRPGTFIYTLSSANFSNFTSDQFQVTDLPANTVKDICIVTGQFVGLSGDSAKLIKVSARTVDFPARAGNKIVSGDVVYTFLDSEGRFQLSVLRGATVLIEAPRAAIRHQILVPDQSTANLLDLLPAFAINYNA